MAKNNFKAKEATDSANYAQGIGTAGQDLMGTGVAQQAQGFGNLAESYGAQKNFASMLSDAAAGKGGPTLADQQIKDATARNNANAAGFAAGAKGLSPALGARQALMAQSGNNQQAAGQAATTRIQEQLAARAQLGNALQGQAGTAGGMTQAGQGAAATGGGLANASNANLIGSRNAANTVNADVAKQNTGAINGAISGVMNAAGGAFGLAEGGVVPGEPEGTQSDETSIALSHGGQVPNPGVPHGAGAMPRRSFAAQVAHHLSREYFDEGGEAHGSYDFAPMDLRSAKGHKPKPQYVPHNTGLDATATGGATSAGPGHEGTDSEGKEKKLKLAEGGEAEDVGEETSFERQVRERREAHDRDRDKQTQNDMNSLEKASSEKKLAFGGEAEDDYNPAADEEEDNEPDTDADADQSDLRFADGGEAKPVKGLDKPIVLKPGMHVSEDDSNMDPHLLNATGRRLKNGNSTKLSLTTPVLEPGQQPAVARKAEGGDISAGGGDESAGASMAKPALHPAVAAAPSSFAARLGASPMGKAFGLGGDEGARARGVNVDGAGAPPPVVAAAAPKQRFNAFNFEAGGPVPGQAKVEGNSLKNDVVDAKLSPGEVVLPRTVAHDPEKAAQFVKHLMAHGGNGHEALKDIKKKRKA